MTYSMPGKLSGKGNLPDARDLGNVRSGCIGIAYKLLKSTGIPKLGRVNRKTFGIKRTGLSILSAVAVIRISTPALPTLCVYSME
jgi:hypothetical protein